MISWQVKIHPLVLSEDFERLSSQEQIIILKAINKKLALDPKAYGKPLTNEFKGLWRLRVENYRVIYRIVKSQILVLVIKVGIRKDDAVYLELAKRLSKT